ncbi:MAG: CPBP family intramembrane glutamic endopeptidase [Bacteroidota bacterium]
MESFRQIVKDALNAHPFVLLLVAFLTYLLLLLTLGSGLIVLVGAGTGHDLLSASEALKAGSGFDSAAAWAFRGIQSVNQFAGYGLAALLLGWTLGRPVEKLSLRPSSSPIFLFLAMAAIIASLPLVQMLMLRPEYFTALGLEGPFWERLVGQEGNAHELLEAIFVGADGSSLLGNLLVFAILPAICEELFFRGLIQRQFQKKMNPHLAIWLAAAIFSFIHFQFLGFFSRWVLGAMLGYFLYYSRSLWPSIFAHFCFNAVSVVGASFYPELAEPDYQFSWGPVLMSLVLGSLLMSLYVRQGRLYLQTGSDQPL